MRWKLPSNTGFRGNAPFPNAVFDSFLDPALFRDLQQQFPEYDSSQARNERGEVGRKAVFPKLRQLGPAYVELDEIFQSADFLQAIGRMTGIDSLLYDAEYVGGGCHLNLNGQDLDLHVDFNYHPRTRTHRRLNLILFLNDEWSEDWGGCLELQSDPRAGDANRIVSVTPAPNRAVVFETSEHSWHGFRRIQMPEPYANHGRRSIAVYFYTRQRPQEEIAPAHGTFYLARPLPDHLQPGYTLTPEDVHEIQVLTQRRDTLIDHLYKRELEFSRVLHSPSVRLGQALTAPLRWLKRALH
jgi:Rps23 Pro-64 3,4-dihydroxylase Tpa1-like proline 4-hydroxylase